MGIDATTRNVLKLFSSPNEVFKIPIYQRRYSWTEDQWGELWEDLISLKEGDIHFLGSLVVVSDTHKPGLNYFAVVDGQQRLTTLLILLSSMRDIYLEQEDQESAKYFSNLLFSSYFKDKSPKLLIGNLDKRDFESLLNKSSSKFNEEGNVGKAYHFFIEKLKNIKDIDSFKELLINNVELVQITTDSSRDAFRLFETLNDRGLNLSAIDLIKNHILRKVSEESREKLDESIKIWDNIISNLKNIDKIVFIRQYYLAMENIKVSRSKLYDSYQKKIKNSKDIYSFLEELQNASDIYSKIINQETESGGLNSQLKNLADIEATTSYTVILKLLLEGVELDLIEQIAKLLQIFSLRISICKWSTSDMESVYLDIIKNYNRSEDVLKFVNKILKDHSPEDTLFNEKFVANDFRQNNQTKHILECFENEKTNYTEEKNMADRLKVHIEHIMPKIINSKKSKKEFGNWENYLGEDSKLHKEYVSKIGNLTLLGAKLNIISSNNPFEEKKKNYLQSNIKITYELAKLEDWKIKEIKLRPKNLGQKALKIWSFS